MAKYAVIQGSKVINLIVADSKAIAEEATGFLCVEYTDDLPLNLNDEWDGTKFILKTDEE